MHTPWIITIYELMDDLRTLWRILMYRLADIAANANASVRLDPRLDQRESDAARD
jgi:hypothetical protein